MDKKIPNPGSALAQVLGCKCPVMDNHHGAGYMGMPNVFVMQEDCPLHGKGRKEYVTEPNKPKGRMVLES